MATTERLRKVIRDAPYKGVFLIGCALTSSCGTADDVRHSRVKAQAGIAGSAFGGEGSIENGGGTVTNGTPNTVGVAGQNGGGGDAGSSSGGTFGSSDAGSGSGGIIDVGGTGGSLSTQGGRSGTATGGEGGAVNACSGAASRYCDDGNNCTIDSCDPQSGCLHVSTADDLHCDDHDICTRNDRCLAGICVGQMIEQKAELLGQFNTIGGYEELENHADFPIQGLSVALTENLALFAEPRAPGMRLALVQVEPSNLRELDSVFTYASLVQSGNWGWSPSSGTHLVRLSSSRVAVVTTHHDIEIYDVAAGKLTLRAYRYLFEDAIGDVFVGDVKGRDKHLWVMTPMKLTSYEVGPDGAISTQTQFPIPDSVSSFAVTEDINSIYVGGQGGIFRVDVSDPLHPVTDTNPVIPKVTSRRAYNLDIRNDYLLLHEEVFFGTPGDVRVFRIADWKEVAAFPSSSPLGQRFTAPTGAAFVDTGLLLQRIRYDDENKPKELTAELYTLGESGAVLLDEWKYRDLSVVGNSDQWQPLSPVVAGRLAIVGPTRRILWTGGDKISEVQGSLQGTLDQVSSGGAGRLFAYGSESTHLIDISNPRVPTLIDGGLLASGESSLIRMGLPRTAQESPSLLNVSPASNETLDGRWRLGSGRLTQFEAYDTSAPRVVGQFVIPGGTVQAVSGGLLFQVTDANDGTWLLRTFDLPRDVQQGKVLAPIETQTLVGTGSLKSGATMAVDVSAHGLILVSSDVSNSTTVVDWFTRNDGHWTLTGSVHVPISSNRKVVLRGDTAVIAGLGSDVGTVILLERVPGQVQVKRTRALPYTGAVTFAGRVLGLDGAYAYVAMREADTVMNSYKIAVHALALDTLETVDRYQLPEIPGSMIVVDDRLVFGARTSLTIANSGCHANGS